MCFSPLVDILIAEDVGNDVEERSNNECDGLWLELKQFAVA